MSRSWSLCQSEIPCSKEYGGSSGHRTSRTQLRSDWMIISFSFTSELHGEITDNVDKGDDSTTSRRFSFGLGLFEVTEILFPGQVLQDDQMLEERESNLPIEKSEKSGQNKKTREAIWSPFFPRN